MKRAMTLGGPALCVYFACWTLYSATRKTEIQLRRDFFENTGLAGSSISKATTYLVLKDPDSTSKKANDARAAGVKILTVEQLKSALDL